MTYSNPALQKILTKYPKANIASIRVMTEVPAIAPDWLVEVLFVGGRAVGCTITGESDSEKAVNANRAIQKIIKTNLSEPRDASAYHGLTERK